MDDIQLWLARKLSRRYAYLRESVTAKYTYRVHTGPRFIYGEVTLAASPSDTFSFISAVTWPEKCDYGVFVIDGILDVLIPFDLYPLLGVTFVLQTIGWDNIDSAPIGYYYAAKEAARHILRIDEPHQNIEWRTS